jgi:hypothetical protein
MQRVGAARLVRASARMTRFCMSMFSRWLLAPVIFAGVAACSGAGEVGEACDQEARADQCVDGAACAKNKAGALQCMQICVAQTDCAANTECTGTTGTTKVCQ